jgi:hypothetical protein
MRRLAHADVGIFPFSAGLWIRYVSSHGDVSARFDLELIRIVTERLLAQVVQVLGSVRAYQGHLFDNARDNRMKLFLHVALAYCVGTAVQTMRIDWPRGGANMAASITLTKQEFDALVLRTPRSRLGKM